MSVYKVKNIDKLVKKIKKFPKIANKVMANTLNRTGTQAVKLSISEITKENNLSPEYLKGHLKVSARARSSNLRTVITADDRQTLLSRYPSSKVKGGVRVSVRKGSSKLIKKASLVNLRSGNGKGVGLRNKDYLRYLQTNTPLKSTGRGSKIAKAKAKKLTSPYGWHILHAASVNQMFKEKRSQIKPDLHRFQFRSFFEEFRKKLNATN